MTNKNQEALDQLVEDHNNMFGQAATDRAWIRIKAMRSNVSQILKEDPSLVMKKPMVIFDSEEEAKQNLHDMCKTVVAKFEEPNE